MLYYSCLMNYFAYEFLGIEIGDLEVQPWWKRYFSGSVQRWRVSHAWRANRRGVGAFVPLGWTEEIWLLLVLEDGMVGLFHCLSFCVYLVSACRSVSVTWDENILLCFSATRWINYFMIKWSDFLFKRQLELRWKLFSAAIMIWEC